MATKCSRPLRAISRGEGRAVRHKEEGLAGRVVRVDPAVRAVHRRAEDPMTNRPGTVADAGAGAAGQEAGA